MLRAPCKAFNPPNGCECGSRASARLPPTVPHEVPTFLFDFKAKLKRLNPALYITESTAKEAWGWKALGIYRRRAVQENFGSLKDHADSSQLQYMRDQESGFIDEYICGVPAEWVPDTPIFDSRTKNLQAPCWRSIIITLWKRGLVDLDKAKRVFGSSSLYERDFDRLDFDAKRDLVMPKRRINWEGR